MAEPGWRVSGAARGRSGAGGVIELLFPLAADEVRPAAAPASRGLLLLGPLLVLVGLAALALQRADLFRPHIAALLAQGAVYALCVWVATRPGVRLPLWFILAVAVAIRIGPLLAPPYLSSDIFRYVWDGRVQGAGINPYLYVPNDPALSALRDAAVWPFINRAEYAHTIYPPAAELVFLLATRMGATVLAMKATLLLFDAVTVWAVLRLLAADGRPREHVIAYAWCPLIAWEFAGSGHVDAAMTAFVALALLARRRDAPLLTGLALGLAVLTKFFPLLLVPALWRRWDWRLPAAMLATIVLGYLLYLKAGWGVFGFLSGYAGEEGLDDGSGFWLLDTAGDATDIDIPALAYVGVAALAMAGLALWTMFRLPERRRLTFGPLLLAAAGMLLLSPNYPWYFAWLLPMVCLAPPAWPIVWLAATGPLLYFADWDDSTIFWSPNIVYGGAFAVLAAVAVHAICRRWLRGAAGRPASA